MDHRPHTDHKWPLPWGFNGSLQQPYRYLAGRPMNGHRYTDATWRYPATMSLDVSGRSTWYHRLPGWKRALYFRLLPPYLLVQGGHDLSTAGMRWIDQHSPIPAPDFAFHESFVWDLSTQAWVVTPLVLAGVGLKAVRSWRGREWRNEVTTPLATAIAPLIGAKAAEHRSWLEVPRSYLDENGPAVVVHLPQGYVGQHGAQKTLVDTITARLGMGDVSATWNMKGSDPTLELTEKAKPPEGVSFSDARPYMANADEDAPIIGLGVSGRPFSISLKGDSPHIMVTGGSGGGKSVLVMAIVAHFLHHGARIVIIDPKGDSHIWANGLPGVTYAYRTQDIHETLLEVAAEQSRRIEDAANRRRPSQRLIVVAEEMNMGIPALRDYWAETRENSDPKSSPAIKAANNLAFGGRSMLMNVLWVTQSSTARAYGGTEARENYAVNCMARQSSRQWKMINAGIPMPKATKHMGRWVITSGGETNVVQVTLLTEDDARGWSLSGANAVQGEQQASATDPWSAVAPPEEPTLEFARLTTLRDIAARNNLSLRQVRRWAERDEAFPRPVMPSQGNFGAQYDEADISMYLLGKIEVQR